MSGNNPRISQTADASNGSYSGIVASFVIDNVSSTLSIDGVFKKRAAHCCFFIYSTYVINGGYRSTFVGTDVDVRALWTGDSIQISDGRVA